jgi:uncharacterized coiled-coil DUF342 family protein
MTSARAVFSVAVLMLLAGCGVTTRDTSTTTGAMRDTTSMGARLVRLDEEIAQLAERARNADRKVQAVLTEEVAALKARRDSTARALDELKATGSETWDRAKEKGDTLLLGLERAVQRTRAALSTRDSAAARP